MKLSIITINYNNASGLKRTLDSVAYQTWRAFEHIIVDGGSTDGSKELIEEYTKRNETKFPILWISEADNGIYNAMNKGIKMASGEYCLFLNSGDWLADEDILNQVIKAGLDKDIVCGNAREDGTDVVYIPSNEFTYRNLQLGAFSHQAMFIKRLLFEEIAYYSEDLKVLADAEFNLKACLHDCSYKHIALFVAIVEAGGVSNTMLDVMQKEDKLIKDRNVPQNIQKDYDIWMNHKTFSHPAVEWAIVKQWPLNIIKLLYNIFLIYW